MASKASTPSEGEIVEAKRPQSRSSSRSPVNRPPRRVLYSRSPSPTASTAPSRTRRSRSRSPYRNRGSKRHNEEDHYTRRDRDDPRRFRVRYEERHDRHADIAPSRAFEDRRRRTSREHRRSSPSRSPSRFRGAREDDRSRASHRRDNKDNVKASSKQLVSDQGNPVSATAFSRSIAETHVNQIGRDAGVIVVAEQADTREPVQSQSIDVDALREQKRKKWEAIRAKHRTQPQPLLKQALDGNLDHSTASSISNTTGATTPTNGPSEASSAPGTPRSASSRESTPTGIDFSRDTDLANVHVNDHGGVTDDEPSAADYDATMDMDEDKKRHDHRLQSETAKAPQEAAMVETKGQGSHEITTKKPKNEFDMFADGGEDEDEDDMFAPASTSKSNGGQVQSKSKALNVDTIDDFDDDQGYYRVILGELLDGRYHVQSNLGKGMFSSVVRALDRASQKLVAIKVIRSNETMRKAAAKEIGILEKLKQADPEDRKHVIRLERSFEHKGHLCMVFENLNENLREVLKKFGRDVGIDLQAVRVYAQQIFKGLSLLRKCTILHADLKPDNILVNERRTLLKICDLGSAADASESEITPYLVSRFYRAPEIILGMPYDYAIDTWSIGCTLFELFTGKILFTGRSNNQMLRTIMECRGRFSTKMLRKCEFAGLHFDEQGTFRSVEHDRVTGKDVVRVLNFLKPTKDLRTRLMGASRDPDLNSFLDLLDKCLILNPEKRINPTDALKHPFLARKL